MKKIILKAPVDFSHGGKVTNFAAGREYVVADDVADNSFLKAFISREEVIPSEPEIVAPEAAPAPAKAVRRRRRVASE